MRTFSIQTLGCKVNQYESEQIATLLRARGMTAVDSAQTADLRIINTCSVTMQAASKSRQSVRRAVKLNVLGNAKVEGGEWRVEGGTAARTIVTGCWATSNPAEARSLSGVDAVIGHHDDVASELNRILDQWDGHPTPCEPRSAGTHSLPLLGDRQTGHQRAMLKVQDGCDAHCTYCIIPTLRPTLWSKPIDDVVEEAKRLVDSGHFEIVLTGIFLGAYGQPTALRRRQPAHDDAYAIAKLTDALCTRVPGLRRLRFSSLEPGDLTPGLIRVMRSHEQVVPHFHLPLQSGSDAILRRMNRQYTRDDFLWMIDDVNIAFDRPAITTDIIVGFPGETDAEFDRTLEVVDRAKFIHVHAFSFSPRPGTAAARWSGDFVRGPIVNQRIECLDVRAAAHSRNFREQFVGQTVEVLVEKPSAFDTVRHGRCERYFDVHFEDSTARAGDAVHIIIDRVTESRTIGTRIAASDERRSELPLPA